MEKRGKGKAPIARVRSSKTYSHLYQLEDKGERKRVEGYS